MAEVKVLFILGKGRSGSTLLDNILGSTDGVFTTGELHHLWDRGLRQGWSCGCGEAVPDCPTWQAILREVGEIPTDAAEIQRAAMSWLRIPRILASCRWGRVPPGRRLERWTDAMGRLYRAIATVSGAKVLVDASKVPANPAAFGLVPGVRPYVVQLVRDPRAVAHSWRRHKPRREEHPGAEMSRYGAVHSAASWIARHGVLELARGISSHPRWLRVRYEDLTRRPADELRRVLGLVGEPASGLPFTGERSVRLERTHTVGGNPDRIGREVIEVREDVEWLTASRPVDLAVVTALTAPLLGRYGYPLRPARSSSEPQARPSGSER